MHNSKKTLFYFLLLIGIAAYSQDYKPMLSNLNEWKVTNCNFGCLTDTYYTDGDTLVDNVSYKILDGYHYISRAFLLREDIAKKQVFIKMFLPSGVEDYLLYDFSLEVGDTFTMNNPITPFPANGGSFILDSIESHILEDGESYRHFYFSPAAGNTSSTENAVWIEGIGSLSIINAPGGHPDINGVGHLSCAFKDELKVYENLDSIANCIPDILSVYDATDLFEMLQWRQNETHLFIENASNSRMVTIYDLSGKKTHDTLNSSSEVIAIPTNTMANGLYFARVFNKNGSYQTFKFVVK